LIQFNTILKTDPNNVIALNNAAIIYYQLSVNVQLRSLIDYQTALNLASGNRLLLDNIAVALQSYQGDTKIPVYINLEKSFTIADQQMQIIMAKQNLYRSGAVWVNSDMKRQIDAQEEAFQKQKEILQTSYDNAQNSLTGVNNQLNALAQQIPQMQQNIQTAEQPTVVTGSNGQTYFQPANNQLLISQDQQQLAQMQQQQQNDQTQQVQLQTQIQTIQIAAKRLMQSNASMGFSGEQLMMLPGDLVNVPPPLPVSLLSNTQNSAGGPGN